MNDNKKRSRAIAGRTVIGVILLILLLSFLRTAFYTVKESEQAVVQTFGRYSGTAGPGLHIKLPWPIQRVSVLPVQRTQKLELGYYQDGNGQYHSDQDDSLMITGDMNLVNIDFFLEWKISDPVKYLFRSEDPILVLRNMLMSSVRSIVGIKNIDETLTTGKFEIANEVQDMLMQKLEENDIGVQILDVKLNDSEPPTEAVAKAFRDVETAKQQKDTALNQANEYKNRVLPQAEAQADRLVKEAEANKQSRINEAEGLRDRYLAIYSEYKMSPEVNRERLYLELLKERLPGLSVVVDESGNLQKYLPLHNDMSDEEAAAVEEKAAEQP